MKNLLLIKSHYYFNVKTPACLKAKFPNLPALIRFSLHTKEKNIATKISNQIKKKLCKLVFEIMNNLITDIFEIQRKLLEMGIRTFSRQNKYFDYMPKKASELFEQFKNEKVKSKSWRKATELEYAKYFKYFLEYAGKTVLVENISHRMLLTYRKRLERLTSYHQRKQKRKQKPLSNSQINKYLLPLLGLLDWSHKHEIIKHNPAHDLYLPIVGRKDSQRKAFTTQQLLSLKKSILSDRNKFCEEQKRPERFWVPMIAMYSGMRLNECCQLELSDIKESGGILCFDINNKGKNKYVKNNNAIRCVPIHPELVHLGFIEFLDKAKKNNHTRLFNNLKFDKRSESYGKSISRWFAKYKKNHITDTRLLAFHSFRHSVATALKHMLLPTEIISELLGHSNQNITTSRYGKKYSVEILLETLKKLPY